MKRDLHLLKNPRVKIEALLKPEQARILDARSPKEFASGAVVGAENLSLLDDSQRAEVGLLYKRIGSGAAIDAGYGILQAKIDALKARLSDFSKDEPLLVYCARGGMRSGVLTSLLRQLGFDARQVEGGYKAYRNLTLSRLEALKLPKLVVLQGRTGVGKTDLIKRLTNAIDLEGLAGHRGSLFGGIGLNSATQKNFEAKLLHALNRVDLTRPLFIEGESRKIGPVSLPSSLFNAMLKAKVLLLEAPLAIRAGRIVDEYISPDPTYPPQVRQVMLKLKLSLGQQRLTDLLALFDKGEYQACFAGLLEYYYDLKYEHTLKNLKIDSRIDAQNMAMAANKVKAVAAGLFS